MKLGYIGLGKMGKNMVLHLLDQGMEVVAWNRSPEPLGEVTEAGATPAKDISDLISKIDSPKTIWIMLPQGDLVDQFIADLVPHLKQGDLIIDGGNSFYKDSVRRAKELSEKGIHFMDIGTSGGPGGARSGACLMIGGERSDFERVEDLLKAIAAPGAYGYFGKSGAGHFAKMVHNGIEYGMMEAIGEGAAILKKSEFEIDLKEVFRVYNKGSVIESRLVGWIHEALEEDPELSDISSKIAATGEGEWTVNAAKGLGLDVRVIEESFKVRQESKEDSGDFRAKTVSAMRGKFGGHPVKKSS
jgi:6-phosphogluconate dehydrogenase